jgi:hypothetical protein
MGAGLIISMLVPNYGAAQEDLAMSMTMRKEIRLDNNSTIYRMAFDLSGDPLKKVRQVSIAIPNGKRMVVQNKFRLNIMNFEVVESDYQKLVKTYPEGQYRLLVSPRIKTGKRKAFLSHDFPAGVALLYPAASGEVLPLSFTAQWYPLADLASSIFLEIKGPNRHYSVTLSPTATSFTIPQGLLEPNLQYELMLGVSVQGESESRHETVEILSFTSAPQ